MDFNKYIQKHKKTERLINTTPSNKLFNIIVIPVLNEPDILKYLQSIINCDKPKYNVEVLLIINSSEIEKKEVVEQNKQTFTQLQNFAKEVNTEKLSFHPLIFESLPKKQAGAGLARKFGMDEAILRYQDIEKDGVITSLDADTIVEKNYLTEIEKIFLNNKINGATIYYEHPISGNEETQEVYNSIINYELYLRYYYQVLKYVGVPYSYHTIGSAFAVRASAYVKQGGMRANQAGEDFYFLQKIIPMSGFVELNTTAVYPSSRVSYRVIFGTGPAVGEISKTKNQIYNVYCVQSFIDLNQFVSKWDTFYNILENEYNEELLKLPESILLFLTDINFYKDLKNINNNTTNINSFKKAFFTKFDAFKVIRFLNTSHEELYKKQDVKQVANKFLHIRDMVCNSCNTKQLLEFYRGLETKNNG